MAEWIGRMQNQAVIVSVFLVVGVILSGGCGQNGSVEAGEQTGQEGCLSLPGKVGIVTRANYAKVKALDENMEEIFVEGEGLLARALQHEVDHLSGEMYVSKVEGELLNTTQAEEQEQE